MGNFIQIQMGLLLQVAVEGAGEIVPQALAGDDKG